MNFIIVCIAICVLTPLLMFILYLNAPIGWEDETGFHNEDNSTR
jgi:hypothetical protein